MTQGAVTAAVITASVAVVIAVLAQVSTWYLEHRNRVYERRRAALLDVQDAALQVRQALRRLAASVQDQAIGEPTAVLTPVESPRAEAEREDAEALLALRVARVDSLAVRAAVETWQETARYWFLDEDGREAAGRAWNAMNELMGWELSVPGWWQRRRGGTGSPRVGPNR